MPTLPAVVYAGEHIAHYKQVVRCQPDSRLCRCGLDMQGNLHGLQVVMQIVCKNLCCSSSCCSKTGPHLLRRRPWQGPSPAVIVLRKPSTAYVLQISASNKHCAYLMTVLHCVATNCSLQDLYAGFGQGSQVVQPVNAPTHLQALDHYTVLLLFG